MAYFLSVIFILVGAPLAMRRVGPNRWYGFRTAQTLATLEAWYRINALGGKALIVAGIVSLVVLVLFGNFWTGDTDTRDRYAIVIPLGLLAVAIFVALMRE